MNRGYIRIWRKVLDSGWLKNHKLWVFWSYCLLKATHKEYGAIVGLQVVYLMPGQFIFGRMRASKETGLTEREIRTILAFLIKVGNLTIITTNKYSIITIVNWHIYQSCEDENDQLNDQQVTNKGPHTIIKEYKNKEYTPEFLSFWNAYPKKSGSKKAAFENWNKLGRERPNIEVILAAIEGQIKWRENGNGEFRPEWKDPERWIKKKMWEVELIEDEGDNNKTEESICPRCHAQIPPADRFGAGCIHCESREATA